MKGTGKTLGCALIGLLSFTLPVWADLTFSQWEAGPAEGRAIYAAGVLETAGVYAEIFGYADRWTKCLAASHLSYGAVGDAVSAYAKKNPIMASQPAPAVFIAYMNERCGLKRR